MPSKNRDHALLEGAGAMRTVDPQIIDSDEMREAVAMIAHSSNEASASIDRRPGGAPAATMQPPYDDAL